MNLNASNFISVNVQMTNTTNTFIIDCGADISIFKRSKIHPSYLINITEKIKLTGITDDTVETIASAVTDLYFEGGLCIKHKFHLVNDEFPIMTDGILGRDFLSSHRCIIDYESWLLKFNVNNEEITIPIQDNLNNGFILPKRSEVIRRIINIPYTYDMVVHSQEILPGVFCGNTIISSNNPYVKFINTTENPVHILYSRFQPIMEPLYNYHIMKINSSIKNKKNRQQDILNQIKTIGIPLDAVKGLQNLIAEYHDIFSLPDDVLTFNNFYTQEIPLQDNCPIYIPNYKNLHAQTNEIQKQVDKMLGENIIEHSVSPYNSPILLVPKKSDTNDKKWRLVVDFRQLNKKILADKFPLPRIDTILINWEELNIFPRWT